MRWFILSNILLLLCDLFFFHMAHHLLIGVNGLIHQLELTLTVVRKPLYSFFTVFKIVYPLKEQTFLIINVHWHFANFVHDFLSIVVVGFRFDWLTWFIWLALPCTIGKTRLPHNKLLLFTRYYYWLHLRVLLWFYAARSLIFMLLS